MNWAPKGTTMFGYKMFTLQNEENLCAIKKIILLDLVPGKGMFLAIKRIFSFSCFALSILRCVKN
jgi:hypothetical protein